MGHRVSYLVPAGSHCDFAQVIFIQEGKPWEEQIPADVDIAHFQFNPHIELDRPYLVTEHGNARKVKPLPCNTNFLVYDGRVTESVLLPEELGLKRATMADIRDGTAVDRKSVV